MIPRGPGSSDPEAIRRYLEQQSDAVNGLLSPRNVFKGTLRTSETTSSFIHPEIHVTSVVFAMPLTANAQSVTLRQSATEKGKVTFTHVSDANADKTYLFAIFTSPLDVRTAS